MKPGPVVAVREPLPPPLAIVTSPWTDCAYGPAAARPTGEARVILTVRQDPLYRDPASVSRLHYECKFFLRHLGPGAVPIIPATEIGEIQAYRISKATLAIPRDPNQNKRMPWVETFLDRDNLQDDGDVLDMCWLLHGLFTQAGGPVPPQTLKYNHQVRHELDDDSLVYIKLVGILSAWHGQKLSREMFNRFYDALRLLPECKSVLFKSIKRWPD